MVYIDINILSDKIEFSIFRNFSNNKKILYYPKEEENIKKLLEQQNITIDENSKYYVLDKENLKEIGLGNIELESDQYYIVNYDNLEILYTKGVQIGDNILYKLSDFNKLNEEKDFVEENIKE